jgi:hypothetical protein
MKSMGIQAIIRGKPHRTTIPDKKAPCPLDKVNRQFRVPVPNMLRVSDFCQSARKPDPFSASKFDPAARRRDQPAANPARSNPSSRVGSTRIVIAFCILTLGAGQEWGRGWPRCRP